MGSDVPKSWAQTKRRNRSHSPENTNPKTPAVAADPRMRSGVSRCALGCATPVLKWLWPALGHGSETPAPHEILQVGKPGQNQEIEQHIDEHRNEGDREHRDFGEKEPPENVVVAESRNHSSSAVQSTRMSKTTKRVPPSSAKPMGERNKRREGLVKGAPTAQGSSGLSVTEYHAAHLPLPMHGTRVGTAHRHIEEKQVRSGELGCFVYRPNDRRLPDKVRV